MLGTMSFAQRLSKLQNAETRRSAPDFLANVKEGMQLNTIRPGTNRNDLKGKENARENHRPFNQDTTGLAIGFNRLQSNFSDISTGKEQQADKIDTAYQHDLSEIKQALSSLEDTQKKILSRFEDLERKCDSTGFHGNELHNMLVRALGHAEKSILNHISETITRHFNNYATREKEMITRMDDLYAMVEHGLSTNESQQEYSDASTIGSPKKRRARQAESSTFLERLNKANKLPDKGTPRLITKCPDSAVTVVADDLRDDAQLERNSILGGNKDRAPESTASSQQESFGQMEKMVHPADSADWSILFSQAVGKILLQHAISF